MAGAEAASRIQDAPASGSVADNQAQEVQELADADYAAPLPQATYVTAAGETVSAAEVLRYAGDATFVLRDGIWTDTRFDAGSMTAVDVPFASDAYFDLLSEHPDLGAAFALGQEVIVVLGDTAYRVTVGS